MAWAAGTSDPNGNRQGGMLADSARVEAFSDGVLAIVITLLWRP